MSKTPVPSKSSSWPDVMAGKECTTPAARVTATSLAPQLAMIAPPRRRDRAPQQDVDQTEGFGPETITVTRRHPGERYVYAVQDYSDKAYPQSFGLSLSDAKVFLYVGHTLVRTWESLR